MLREKLYERKNWRGVVHTTWNPDGPGAIRIHLVPPKFSWLKTAPCAVILNGQDVLPMNESWAILLTEFIRGVNAHGPGPMSEETLGGVMQDVFHRVRQVYPGASDEVLSEDLQHIVDIFETVARGGVPEEEIGFLSLSDYAPHMTAPHRMDLIISSMTRDGVWNCNQRCLHCYAAGQPLGETGELGTEEWKRIIAVLRKAKVPQLTFTGGEPTLRSDLPELIAAARWFVTRLNTNGVLLTPELVKKLKEADLDSVQVTLYSHDPAVHNELVGAEHWEETVAGIRNALAAGLNLSVNTPLCTRNRDYLKTVEFVHGLGVQYVTCSGLIVTGNAKREVSRRLQLSEEEITEIVRAAAAYAYSSNMEISFTSPGWMKEQTLREMGLDAPRCGACLSNMAVTPDGQVVPCQSWLADAPLGNLLKDNWKKIWNSGACRRIREQSVRETEVCPLRRDESVQGTEVCPLRRDQSARGTEIRPAREDEKGGTV